ncbi:MAG: hypothetical protein OEM82_08195 [Acidobacteriota bacterium]|nr:hypothetical protein [Acidobacteriota bacterium]MDH3530976.1 hypothetical protein [Acidobacteriota bacterium]
MARSQPDNLTFPSSRPPALLLPAVVLWGIVVAAVVVFMWMQSDLGASGGNLYLIPWSILAGVAILAVPAYIFYKSQFDLFHPLIFGVWSYIFPAFVLGGLILAFGLSNPYFLTLIDYPQYHIPYSLFLVVLGYFSVVVGFYLPFNAYIVRRTENLIPDLNWDPEDLWLPGFVLMMIGIGFNILGFLQGLLGYQRIDETGIFDGLLFFLAVIFLIGNMLLWLVVFQAKDKSGPYYLVLTVLVLMVPLKMALQGNRGSLLGSAIPIALAFWYSGRRLKLQHSFVFGVVLFFATSIGIVYGTTFRMIKGSEQRMDTGDYVGQVVETIDYISRTDTVKLFDESTAVLFARIDNLSSLAVLVANYEQLEPYEASYGLKDNIYNDLVTSLVPRFLWPDKPSTSDPRAFGDLYFNYGENSFAITPFGDLLRNFGLPGVVLGMVLVGFYLRMIYSILIETERPRIWKKMAFFPLLIVISYESFYATYFPSFVRTVFVIIISLLIIKFLAPRRSLPE